MSKFEMIFNISGKEYNESLFLIETINNISIKKRIDNNLRWYIKEAVKSKVWYYLLSAITIIAPIASGIILLLQIDSSIKNIISAIVLGISTTSASFLTLFDVKTKWSLYRNQAEEIKRILALYATNDSNIQNEADLLKEIENSIKKTDKKWTDNLKNE